MIKFKKIVSYNEGFLQSQVKPLEIFLDRSILKCEKLLTRFFLSFCGDTIVSYNLILLDGDFHELHLIAT